MFRLFLAAPHWVKLLAFIASPEELSQVPESVWQEIVASFRAEKSPKEPSDKEINRKFGAALEAFRSMPSEQREAMPRQIIELLDWSPTDEEAKFRAKQAASKKTKTG